MCLYPLKKVMISYMHGLIYKGKGSILAAFLVCLPAFVIAQETGSENQPLAPSEVVESPMSLDSPVTTEKNELLSMADQAVKSLMPLGSQAAIDVVRVEPGDPPVVYLRCVVDWVEFVNKVRLDKSFDMSSPEAFVSLRTQLEPSIHRDLLERPILTQEQVNAALSSCDPNLQATVKKLRPPFFNNWTGIHWDPIKDYLALETSAVVDISKNQCVRGIVDLRTGDVVCIRDMACVVD